MESTSASNAQAIDELSFVLPKPKPFTDSSPPRRQRSSLLQTKFNFEREKRVIRECQQYFLEHPELDEQQAPAVEEDTVSEAIARLSSPDTDGNTPPSRQSASPSSDTAAPASDDSPLLSGLEDGEASASITSNGQFSSSQSGVAAPQAVSATHANGPQPSGESLQQEDSYALLGEDASTTSQVHVEDSTIQQQQQLQFHDVIQQSDSEGATAPAPVTSVSASSRASRVYSLSEFDALHNTTPFEELTLASLNSLEELRRLLAPASSQAAADDNSGQGHAEDVADSGEQDVFESVSAQAQNQDEGGLAQHDEPSDPSKEASESNYASQTDADLAGHAIDVDVSGQSSSIGDNHGAASAANDWADFPGPDEHHEDGDEDSDIASLRRYQMDAANGLFSDQASMDGSVDLFEVRTPDSASSKRASFSDPAKKPVFGEKGPSRQSPSSEDPFCSMGFSSRLVKTARSIHGDDQDKLMETLLEGQGLVEQGFDEQLVCEALALTDNGDKARQFVTGVSHLMELGFPRNVCSEAILTNDLSVEKAFEYLDTKSGTSLV